VPRLGLSTRQARGLNRTRLPAASTLGLGLGMVFMVPIVGRNIGRQHDKIETQIKRLRPHGGGALMLRKTTCRERAGGGFLPARVAAGGA
jgi:hypothetical protein